MGSLRNLSPAETAVLDDARRFKEKGKDKNKNVKKVLNSYPKRILFSGLNREG